MENLIQLFLWLQGSARLDKGKAANRWAGVWGLSAAPAGRQSPTGLEPRWVEAMLLQKSPLELPALETAGRNAQGEG